MSADLILIRALSVGLEMARISVVTCDKVVRILPGVSWVRGRVLDTFLGPEESFDTTPRTL